MKTILAVIAFSIAGLAFGQGSSTFCVLEPSALLRELCESQVREAALAHQLEVARRDLSIARMELATARLDADNARREADSSSLMCLGRR